MKNEIMQLIYELVLSGERIYDIESNGQGFMFKITFQKSTECPYIFAMGPNRMIHTYTDKYDIFDYKTQTMEYGP